MKFKEVVLEILQNRGLRKTDLAKNVEVSRQALNNQLVRNQTWLDVTMIKWLDGCGYKLVAMPKELPLPKDSYELK